MLRYFKTLLLTGLLLAGILLAGTATAAPVINFSGEFRYDYNNSLNLGVLSMEGFAGTIEGIDESLLKTGDPVSFSLIWKQTLFTDMLLNDGSGDALLSGGAGGLSDSPSEELFVDFNIFGPLSINGGELAGLFPSGATFSGFLVLSNGYVYSGMDQSYSGVINARIAATPIPGAFLILGSGLIALVGFKRRQQLF
ncbi:MAG: hypothetical protein HUN04_23810 [Desulfobacter sp.]|nr:MAG: hypothetical protein HUN04_23810 [Desulfobacter sp.]